MKETNDLPRELRNWLAGSERTVIAGIGNPIRKDDLVGVRIIRDLQGKVFKDVVLIECETVPETYLQEIVELEPSHVLLVDAAVLGLTPGEARLIGPEQVMNFPAITTHVLPLRIFCEYITKATKAKIIHTISTYVAISSLIMHPLIRGIFPNFLKHKRIFPIAIRVHQPVALEPLPL